MDGPESNPAPFEKKGGGSSKTPTTTFIEVKSNQLSKKTTSGGPGDSAGGKQGKYKQPY